MKRQSLITVSILSSLAFSLLAADNSSELAEKTEAKKPNIIIIMADDMGYGGVSCFDNQHYKTPEIDRLAEEGMKLTDFHSNGSVCSPTRAALMTGRYQQRSGLDNVVNADPAIPMHHVGIHDKEWTYPEAMKEGGYKTGIFGKWHLGYKPEYNPLNHGFDEFIGFISGNIDAHSHLDRVNTKDWWKGKKLMAEEGYHTDLINSHAIDFIDKHKDSPFFLYVAHGSPHSPFQARGSKIQRGASKGQVPVGAPQETYSDKPGSDDWLMRHFVLPVDEGVGAIREKVIELGLADHTIILFISDNGADRNNGTDSKLTREKKGSFYEGGHRVPAVIWSPSKITKGSVSDELMLTFDLMPTSMKLAGISTPEGLEFDGRDISLALFENKTLPLTTTMWNRAFKGGALRQGDLKIVVNNVKGGKATIELYDLSKDPQEKNNLANDQPEKTQAMRAIYDKMLSETRAENPYKHIKKDYPKSVKKSGNLKKLKANK